MSAVRADRLCLSGLRDDPGISCFIPRRFSDRTRFQCSGGAVDFDLWLLVCVSRVNGGSRARFAVEVGFACDADRNVGITANVRSA